ncbi:MAG: hypothetical protein HLUCCA11_23470 [Phormidesmis priestleyi Ana]|uniref:Uncharacterized protein n=1 Tax=Phormidesmis priestleyi Ana TaxID=1666911 RepID=A0A0P7ZA53_9CYAN|nr:MAG: hypothetical protein HLUCCA11_23470 [Phormidesmis priestleyi Ana]
MAKSWQFIRLPSLSIELRINYIYMEAQTAERFKTASTTLGWAYRSLAQHCIHVFLEEYRAFYALAAHEDYIARELTEKSYYEILESSGDLPEYKKGKPNWAETPLSKVPAPPTTQANRYRYNTISLSDHNAVCLKVAQIVHEVPLTVLVSRIVKDHFERYWKSGYLPQIQMHEQKTFDLSKVKS